MPFLVTTGTPVTGLAFACALALVGLGLGRRVLRWLGARGATALEHGVLALSIGTGLLQFVPFALGAAGQLGVVSLRIALALVALAVVPDLVAALRRLRAELAHAPHPEPWLGYWVLALSPAFALALLTALAPTIDPDGLTYHLTVPKRWLQSGSLVYLPTYVYSNTPMGMEMLFMSGLAVAGDVAAKMVHYLFGVLSGFALFLAGVRLRGPVTGVLAATLGLVGPVGYVSLIGCAYLEGGIALAMIASSLAWLIWFRSGEQGFLRCACLLAGIAVTYKLTALLFPVGLGVLTFFAWRERRADGLGRALAELVPLTALPVLPWFVRSALVTGNPFFPLFAGLIPSRDYSAATSKGLEKAARYFFWASNRDWSLAKRQLVLGAVAGTVILLGVLAAVRLRSPLARVTAAVLVVATLLQLGATGLYGRYWMPALAVMALPILALLEPFFPAGPRRGALVALAALFSLGMAARTLREAGGSLAELALASVGVERRSFLEHRIPLYPMYEYANRELPEDSRVLTANYCGSFYFDRSTYCGELAQDSLRWTDWATFVADFKNLGITHVLALSKLASEEAIPPAGALPIPAASAKPAILRRLITEHGRPLTQASDQALYAIDTASLP